MGNFTTNSYLLVVSRDLKTDLALGCVPDPGLGECPENTYNCYHEKRNLLSTVKIWISLKEKINWDKGL
eukprot:snap_masked-scaffold_6-processed-gene-18.32-mRNA-1 protein AED:1.00 eAED:1.00 QI:0/0/0/0/1/1/2/0/68